LALVQNLEKDYIHTFVEYLRNKPFSTVSIYALTGESEKPLLTTPEVTQHIERAHMDIS
jgi:hypothetical protein